MTVILESEELRSIALAHRRAQIPLNPWLKIVQAGARGSGLRLSAHEVMQLCSDDAIHTAAYEGAMQDLGEESGQI